MKGCYIVEYYENNIEKQELFNSVETFIFCIKYLFDKNINEINIIKSEFYS